MPPGFPRLRRLSLACAGLGITLALRAAQAPHDTMAPPAVGTVSMPHHAAAAAPAYQAESTRRMAERLARIFRDTDWKTDPNKPVQRAIYYRSLLDTHRLSPAQEFVVRLQLARERLNAGDSDTAVAALEDLRRRTAEAHLPLTPAETHDLGALLGMSYLRLGEQQNCAHMHGQKSCIFPIGPSGVHRLTRGAEGAFREFSALLDANPHDAQSRWLLNVAAMQLGRYPADVPAQWLLPPALFRSDRDVPELPDIAAAAGVDITSHAGGALVEDFDNDGLLDIMVSSSGPLDQMHLFHNNGDGTFTDITAQSGLLGETGGLNLVLTDYNNDGLPDVLVLRGGWWGPNGAYPLSLLRNNGNGTFDDVTEAAGLLSAHPTQTAATADFDNDGLLDLIVPHETRPGDPHPTQLFHNNGDGTFTDIAAASGLTDLGFVKGVAWGDFNNDGRPDLYVSVMGGRNHLFRNDGPRIPGPLRKGDPNSGWRFSDVAAAAGVDKQQNSFATWFFDMDNDGWPDLFVAGYSTESTADVGAFEAGLPNHAELPRLYRNNHDGTFTDVTHAMRLDRAILPMGANFGDLDNDGFLDIYLGTGESSYEALLPNRMFLNAAGRRFDDVTTASGLGHLQKGHSIAFADLEETGSEDIFLEVGGALPGDTYQSALFHNPGLAAGNHSITLLLTGTRSNRLAIGTRLDLTVRTPADSVHPAGTRHIVRTVGFGSSFGGNPLRQHIGLGSATTVETLSVLWPASRTPEVFRNLPADRILRLREGSAIPEPVTLAARTTQSAKHR